MNATLQTIKTHRSIRRYEDRPVDQAHLDQILQAAQAMPSSINAQQVSVVVVRDAARRARIAELAGGQPWVAQAPVFLVFVMDFHKTALAGTKNGKPQVIHESAEGALVGTFDAGLAMGGAILAAESLGLGIVPIGGIRRDPAALIDLLGLPPYTYPVAGLVVGHPADRSATKPRLPVQAFVHQERYDREAVGPAVDAYDETMAEYYRNRGDKAANWSQQVAGTYQQVYFPQVYPTLKSQGFSLDK
jgi:FMN reductase [NAD(P)H]